MSAAQLAPASIQSPEHCPTCGHSGKDWGAWALRQSNPYRLKIIHSGSKAIHCTEQMAKVAKILQLAGQAGISKRQLSGWHLGHWVQMLREDGLAITTEMVKRAWPKKGRYAVYRLEEPVFIEDVSHLPPPKRRPNKAKPATAATVQVSNLNTTNSKLGGCSDE